MAQIPAKLDGLAFVNPGISRPRGPDYVVVELRHDSQVGYSSAGFFGSDQAKRSADTLNRVLNSFNVRQLASLFGMKAAQIEKRITAAPPSLDQPVSAEFAHSGFLRLSPRRNSDARELAKQLNRAKSVWKAAVAPRPFPASVVPTAEGITSRNFEPTQLYLCSPPGGIGAMHGWLNYNARGAGITVCDIEGSWNFTHEDLPRFELIGGELLDDIAWRNHGTAVLGELVSKPGRRGTVGICHKARVIVQSQFIEGIRNPARAISNAAARLRKGDVMLLELQAEGPAGKVVAVQYWDQVYSAIRAAIAKGVSVVEAAGNGNENFDRSIYRETGLQKDSGAIVVGAGVPASNRFDFIGPGELRAKRDGRYCSIGKPRSRIWFSNYGQIVNLQAWGWHVTTLGYGDAQGGPDQNSWYTLRFAGTSSAAAIVAGAAACIQGHAKYKYGEPLSTKTVRSILLKSGTPQERGSGVPLTQHIGPQPNLIKALPRV